MKTLIAVPCMDTLPVGFAESLLNLDKPEGTYLCLKPNSLIYDSRNLLSLTAMDGGYDRVMWFDSDMLFKPDTLRRLSADMDETGADMVTGLYFKRRGDCTPVIYDEIEEPVQDESGKMIRRIHSYSEYPENAVFPVRGCGFGCVMTSVQLLRNVWERFGPAFHPFPWAGEDISFCHRVNLTGAKILCDSRITCGHIGQYVYTEQLFRAVKQHE